MPYTTPDYPAIRDAILRDIANQIADANTSADGDYAIRANAVAAAIEGLYQHQQWLTRQILPDTADADFLERWASLYGLTRLAAATATGTISFTGVAGSAVPIGTEARTVGGIAYLTTAAGVLGGGGTASIAAQAAAAGAAGNIANATALTLVVAPGGVNSAAVSGAMTGGADTESDAALLARLLTRIQAPPQGGAAYDYEAWALAVAGVTGAYVYPLRRGAGTVDVLITAAGGLPGAPLIASVQAAIDLARPVTADCLVLAPVAVPVAVTAALTLAGGTTLATATAAITAALTAYFTSLVPGDTARLSRIRALISDSPGVVDYVLTAPVANTVTLVDSTHVEMPTLGVITLT